MTHRIHPMTSQFHIPSNKSWAGYIVTLKRYSGNDAVVSIVLLPNGTAPRNPNKEFQIKKSKLVQVTFQLYRGKNSMYWASMYNKSVGLEATEAKIAIEAIARTVAEAMTDTECRDLLRSVNVETIEGQLVRQTAEVLEKGIVDGSFLF